MKRWLFPLVVLLTLVLLMNAYIPATATHDQAVLTGLVKVTSNTIIRKCIAPDRLQICRNRSSVVRFETNDERLTGDATLVFNSVYSNPPFGGHMLGIFHLENAGGSWEGTWKGLSNKQGKTMFYGVGNGHAGYEGLVIRWTMERASPSWFGTMSLKGSITREGPQNHKR